MCSNVLKILSFWLWRVKPISVFIFCCFICLKDTIIDMESKVNLKYSIFWTEINWDLSGCKENPNIISKSHVSMQTLSGDFKHTCDKMYALKTLGVRWWAIRIFLFQKFYFFIKGSVRIYIIFFKKLRPLFLYFTY